MRQVLCHSNSWSFVYGFLKTFAVFISGVLTFYNDVLSGGSVFFLCAGQWGTFIIQTLMSFRSEKFSWIYLITSVFAIFSLWNSLVCLGYFSNFILFILYLFTFLFCSHGDFFSLSSQCFWVFMLFFLVVQLLSYVQLFAIPQTAACPASLFFTRACSNSYPSSQWCHPIISSSEIPFSSCLQYFPASGSFPMSQFFTSGSQSIGVSTSASVLSVNIQDWFPLGLTSLISLQSKGLSRVFCNTTFQKHQFFGTQLSLWSSSHIHTWLLEKP